MLEKASFPKATPPNLSREEVINYLQKEWHKKGLPVFQESDGSYSIVVNELQKITLKQEHPGIWVILENGPGTRKLRTPLRNQVEMRGFIENRAKVLGVELGSSAGKTGVDKSGLEKSASRPETQYGTTIHAPHSIIQVMENSPGGTQTGRDVKTGLSSAAKDKLKGNRLLEWCTNLSLFIKIFTGIIMLLSAGFGLYWKYQFHSKEKVVPENQKTIEQTMTKSPEGTQSGRDSNLSNDTKVNIQSSHFNKSPVVVDSPGSHIDNRTNIINILTDKESLGIRDSLGLYLDGKKLGTAIGPTVLEKEGTFQIDEIEFDRPIRDSSVLFKPLEFGKFIIKIDNIERLITQSDPRASGVNGKILAVQAK